jgi:hypothetical protein
VYRGSVGLGRGEAVIAMKKRFAAKETLTACATSM